MWCSNTLPILSLLPHTLFGRLQLIFIAPVANRAVGDQFVAFYRGPDAPTVASDAQDQTRPLLHFQYVGLS